MYNLNTTIFIFESKTNRKEHSGQIKDYLNQLLCSLKCATAQQHFKQWWTQYSHHSLPKTLYWFTWITFSSKLQQRNNYTRQQKKYSKYFRSIIYILSPRNANLPNNNSLISDTSSSPIKSKWTQLSSKAYPTGLHLSQMVTYLFVIGALESWKVQKCEV